MSTIEDRLRNAYQRAAETVRPESLRTSVLPQAELARQAKHRRGWLAPLAAALAVVLVAVGAVTVPRLFPATHLVGPATGNPSIPSPFLVVLRPPDAQVVSAATGRGLAQLPRASAGHWWTQAAARQGSRQFLLVATRDDQGYICHLRFYTLTLSGTGTVASLQSYSTPKAAQVFGFMPFGSGDLAVSADGSTVAFITRNCTTSQWTITVIRDGTVRTWMLSGQTIPAGLSLSANGSLLSYVDSISRPTESSARVLPTDSAPGPADLRARTVFTDQRNGGPRAVSAALSPAGSTMYVLTAAIAPMNSPTGIYTQTSTVAAYDTATGARLRTLHTWHYHGYLTGPPGFTASGDLALIWSVAGKTVDELNLSSGTATAYRTVPISSQDTWFAW
jgi:hypothetical protein